MASGGAADAFLCLLFIHWIMLVLDWLLMLVKVKKSFNGLWDCIKKTATGPKGILGLYQGFGVSVAGIIPYRGVQFGLNDTIKGLNPWDKEVTFVGIVSKWLGAQFSVIMSGYVNYPFDTVRRRLQMEAVLPQDQKLYKGALHCHSTTLNIYHLLWKGLS